MPYGKAELETFIKDLGLPEDKAKAALEAIGSDGAALEKFGSHVLRQADYSTKLNELATEKQRLEADYQAKVEKETKFAAGVSQWKSDKEKEVQAALARATEEAEAKLNAARGKIRDLATRYAIPEEEVKDLLTAPVNNGNNGNNGNNDRQRDDNGRFLSIDQFKTESEFYAKLPGMMIGMDREYYKLFGNDAPPVNWETVIEAAKKNTNSRQPLRDAFESTYKIPEKRAQIDADQRKADIEAAEKRGAEAARSKLLAENPELSGRSVTREHPGSPILDRGRAQQKELEKTGKLPERDHSQRDTVSAAVAAFNSGKYKTGQAA